MVTYLEETGIELMRVLGDLFYKFINLLPGLLGAIILLLIGYFLGVLFEAIIKGALLKAGLDEWVEKHERHYAIGHMSVSGILGAAAKWYVVALFLQPAANLIEMGYLSDLLVRFASWLPNLITGVLIVYFGLMLAHYAEVEIMAHKWKWNKFWATVVKVAIIVFILDVALRTINVRLAVAESTYLIVLSGIVLALAIAIGIGFGGAMKEPAKKWVKKVMK